MSKEKKITFQIEGPDWVSEAVVDTSIFEDERSQIFEAATRGLEYQIKNSDHVNVGAIILVRKGKKLTKTTKEAMVNSYICLNNAAQYEIAETLRKNFKKTTGQDLAIDQVGYSY